jgi:hypothetical protein
VNLEFGVKSVRGCTQLSCEHPQCLSNFFETSIFQICELAARIEAAGQEESIFTALISCFDPFDEV